MEKKYDVYGRQFAKEDLSADCVCMAAPLKSALIKALIEKESHLADEVREQKKFLADLAVKGAKEAGEAAGRRGSFDVVQFTRDVSTHFGEESMEEEKERLKKSSVSISNWKQNQWELFEIVRRLIIEMPTCKGKEPPMDVDWQPPHYTRPPWEK